MRSYQMTFCGYTVFPEHEQFISRFSFRDENGYELSNNVGVIFIELTKLDKLIDKPVATMTGEELWSIFFAHASDPRYIDLINKMMYVKEEIKMAVELLRTISTNEDERARFRARRKFRMDAGHNRLATRDERSMEIAKKLLEIDIPIDKIITATGLSREEIEGLCDAI